MTALFCGRHHIGAIKKQNSFITTVVPAIYTCPSQRGAFRPEGFENILF